MVWWLICLLRFECVWCLNVSVFVMCWVLCAVVFCWCFVDCVWFGRVGSGLLVSLLWWVVWFGVFGGVVLINRLVCLRICVALFSSFVTFTV